jgi:hypothetical protein
MRRTTPAAAAQGSKKQWEQAIGGGTQINASNKE